MARLMRIDPGPGPAIHGGAFVSLRLSTGQTVETHPNVFAALTG